MFDIVGQNKIIESIKSAVRNGKDAHAYIIEGPDGTGKSIFALEIAAMLICESTDKPCGECVPCRKVMHGSHPDVRVIELKKKSIGVGEIRELLEEVYKKPYEGKKKVFIIKDAENVTDQGQNAMLKTLEEPPEDTAFILLASNANLILDTVRSRCQLIRFGRVSEKEIFEYLLSKGCSREKAEVAVKMSDGIVGNALEFMDESFMEMRQDTIKAAIEMTKAKGAGSFDLVQHFVKYKENVDKVLQLMKIWFRDIYVEKLLRSNGRIINRDCYDLIVEESKLLSYNRLDRIIQYINASEERLKQNSNFQLAIEVMLLNIQEV